jgi:hypothetical protein
MVGVNLSLDIARNYCSYCSNVAVTAVETAFAKNVFKGEINWTILTIAVLIVLKPQPDAGTCKFTYEGSMVAQDSRMQ